MIGVCMAMVGLCLGGWLVVEGARKVSQVLVTSRPATLCGLQVLAVVVVWGVFFRKKSDAKVPVRKKKDPPKRPLPPPNLGKHITVLSIDGGGIRGLIPAIILDDLEKRLQAKEKDDSVRIADYFDVIAGTSTGGLIAAMLTIPDEKTGRPKYTAEQIKKFYETKGPQIFSPRGWIRGWLYAVKSIFCGPRYDWTFLHKEIKDITGDTTLADTLANVVVPMFDVRRLNTIDAASFKPVIVGGRQKASTLLSDVCIGTTAAPTYFPAHHFKAYFTPSSSTQEYYTPDDVLCHYHLIDGGVGANNPTMVAISRVAREVLCGNRDFKRVLNYKDKGFKPDLNYKDFVVISIGTGSTRKKVVTNENTDPDKEGDRATSYTAEDCAKWGAIRWIVDWVHWGHKPIIDMFMQASDFLIDQQVATLLHSQGCKNYLRIQPLEVDESCISLGNTTDENMKKLIDIGKKDLLEKGTVYEVNLITGRYQEKNYKDIDGKETRKLTDELENYAQTLIGERKRRLEKKQEKENAAKMKATTTPKRSFTEPTDNPAAEE